MRQLILVVAMAAFLGGCALFSFRDTSGITTDHSHASAMAEALTAYRAQNGLGPVRVDRSLMRAADEQARAVAAMDDLDHHAAGRFGKRMTRNGINGAAAENLQAGAQTPERVLERWQASTYHDENLLMPEARRIGLVKAEAPGTRFGKFWVMVLAD
ncbi:CAP domain-containing protein [Saliniramus sp.]|uniref:CAP domain-containing protein n=1 Tax=Saliniramus sp. TaxID=2986772 RepID=UPI002B67C663|nr:CAP domain-containing protein [Saliniramus sp.]HMB12357.1 CAP domain-containing protein [Saliniramus sp.]